MGFNKAHERLTNYVDDDLANVLTEEQREYILSCCVEAMNPQQLVEIFNEKQEPNVGCSPVHSLIVGGTVGLIIGFYLSFVIHPPNL